MSRDDDVKQAIGAVARLAGFQIKRVATTDDLKDRSLTITITRPSDGWTQDRFAFEETVDQVATVDANGHVESVSTLQTGDLAETEAEANAEIAAASASDPDDFGSTEEAEQAKDPHLVGEVAAAAKRRR